jgi:glycosyltransferase involved in cell wall biosynthesis
MQEKLIKLLIICPVFREYRFCERWHLMTQLYDDVDVTLIAPRRWCWKGKGGYSFGKDLTWEGEALEKPRFRIRLVDMNQIPSVGWFSWRMIHEIHKCQADMIYHIGNEMELAFLEVLVTARLLSPKSKISVFTMRGLPYQIQNNPSAYSGACRNVSVIRRIINNTKNYIHYIGGALKWKLVRKYTSAIFCHYPEARCLFMREGYSNPIYIQTQIGVDSRFYRRDEEQRESIRSKYNLGDSYVFVSATRLALEKGIMEILEALPETGNWKYLTLGSGPTAEESQIRALIEKRGLSEKVILPGLIDWREMPAYWSAADCMIHVPRTTPTWIDTFPVAVAQAMSIGLPVIGNSSGAVPYQLGGEGIIVPEGDIGALRNAMTLLMEHPEKGEQIGRRLRERVLKSFDITHLSHCFHSILLDVVEGVYDPRKMDMADFKA